MEKNSQNHLEKQTYWDKRTAQQIRESSQELRELETKLRAAYVRKSLTFQLAEREKNRLEEKLRVKHENEEIERQKRKEYEIEKMRKIDMKTMQKQYRIDLEEQIIEKRRKRKRLYKEFLKEKILFDEIMRKIQLEQMEELQSKLMKSEQYRADIEELKRDQEQWRIEQQRLAEEENRKIEIYIREQDEKLQKLNEIMHEKRQQQNELQEKMCDELNEIEKNKIERDNILLELKCRELEEKQAIRDRIELEMNIRRDLCAKIELENQRKENQLRKLQISEDEKRFREEQMKLFAENDRLELMSAEKRRLKKIEHRKAIQELLADREQRRNAEILEIVREHEDLLLQEKRRQEIFEEERRKLLRKFASDLIGFLPDELLRSIGSE